MSKMTAEHVEECRAHAATGSATLVDQDFLIALCDLAKLALSPPPDVAGLVEELRGPALEHTQRFVNRAFNNHDRPMPQLSIPADPARDSDLIVSRGILKAADALLSLSARNRGLEAGFSRQADNMAFILNHATLPEQWQEKFTKELAEDRAANLQGNENE